MFIGINLAVSPLSLGIFDDQIGSRHITVTPDYDFSENLMIELARFCKLNQTDLNDIQGFGIANGPGSYTGLRIAVTFAKTFCQIRQIPLWAFSTLESFAFQYRWFEGVYLMVLPACRGEYNTALFSINNQKIQRLTDDFTADTATILKNIHRMDGKIYIVGQCGPELKSAISEKDSLIQINHSVLNGSTLAEMAYMAKQADISDDYKTVFPKYSHAVQIGK